MSSPANGNDRLQVAIIGGGIVGLYCAIALTKEGVDVHIYEATERFSEIGAGIGLSPNAIEIFRRFGILYDVLPTFDSRSRLSKAYAYRYADDDMDMVFDSMEGDEGAGIHRIGVHRAFLLDVLVKHIDPQTTHFGKRIQAIDCLASSGRQTMHFKDGTSAEADVIIGADGIKSTVRRLMFGDEEGRRVVFTGTVAYRGLVKFDDARAAGVDPAFMTRPHCLVWKGKHLIIRPIDGRDLFNIVAFVTSRSLPFGKIERDPDEPWVVPVTTEEMLADFADCGSPDSDTKKFLRCISNPSKWFLHVVYPPLDTYIRGQVVLIGDAAHAMLPHLAAGAGQGLEDAYLLAKLLGRSKSGALPQQIEAALRFFDETRRPRAQKLWEGSRRIGDIYEGYGPRGFSKDGMREDLLDLRDGLLFDGPNKDLRLDALL